MEVIYSKSYIERELYIIKYKDKYLMVYARSGMNPGRKGRIIPFAFLADPVRPTLNAEVPGHIYKEFFFKGMWIPHKKEPYKFTPLIAPFLEKLESFLKGKNPPYINYIFIESFKDMRPLAKEINMELETATKDLEPFDWADLNEGDL